MTGKRLRETSVYYLDDIVAGSHNRIDEGYWDGAAVFDWWRRSGREKGVEYVTNEVVAMTLNGEKNHIESVTLKSGDVIACGKVVNASGPRAILTSRMAGIDIPVEPRKRYTFVFSAANPLDRDLPLTIDPTGVHMRTDGPYYLAGCQRIWIQRLTTDDFDQDRDLGGQSRPFRQPNSAVRCIKLIRSWAGHYAFNTFDHNAILGPHRD